MKIMKKIIAVLLLISSFLLCGCSMGSDPAAKIKDLDFTVISDERLSEELKTIIDERKAAPFKVTFNDKNFLYICIGYGEQKTGGYSIAVDHLYLTEDAVHAGTSLLGPDPGTEAESTPSYPYIVIKTEYLDKPVIFE